MRELGVAQGRSRLSRLYLTAIPQTFGAGCRGQESISGQRTGLSTRQPGLITAASALHDDGLVPATIVAVKPLAGREVWNFERL